MSYSESELHEVKAAYSRLFDPSNPDAKTVLKHLGYLCYFSRTTQGPNIQAKEGRRQVFLEILKLSKVSADTLYELMIENITDKPIPQREEFPDGF